MTIDQTITPDAEGTNRLVVPADDGTTFLIPRAVVEQGRVAGEAAAELERLIETGDVGGFSGGVVLPHAGDQAVYALPAETIDQYRLSPEQAQALPEAGEQDAAGFFFCPPCPAGTYSVINLGTGVCSCVRNTPPAPTYSGYAATARTTYWASASRW